MKICPNCHLELPDEAHFCPRCMFQYPKQEIHIKEKKNRALLWLILVGILLVGLMTGFLLVRNYIRQNSGKKEVDIQSIREQYFDTGEDIEYDSEIKNDLRDILGNEFTDVQSVFGEETEEMYQKDNMDVHTFGNVTVISAIDQINPDGLTAEDTTVQELKDKYNSLSDAQKKLVTNANKLDEYEKLVQSKQAEKEKEDKNWEFVKNLDFYSGVWGDYDTQGNPYREKAKSLIESTISLSDYFSGDVNSVDIGITGFHYQEGQIKSAECAVTFSQINPVDGMYFGVNGLIKLNEEGEFVFVVTYVG